MGLPGIPIRLPNSVKVSLQVRYSSRYQGLYGATQVEMRSGCCRFGVEGYR